MVPPMHPGFRPVVFTSSPRGITLPSHDTPSTQFTDFLTQPILSGEIWLKHQYSCAPHSPTQVPSVVRHVHSQSTCPWMNTMWSGPTAFKRRR